MITLFQHPFCPHSRFVRLVLAEYGLEPAAGRGARWERREEFLHAQSGRHDAGADRGGPPAVPGATIIAEYLDETRGAGAGDRRLLPADPAQRVEVRRLTPGSTTSSSPR